MVHDPPAAQILGIAGEFLPVDGHVVAAVHVGLYAERGERAQHRLTEELHIQRLQIPRIGDKGEVQIPEIVVDRTAAREPPYDLNAVGLHKGLVDLGQSVLVLADDDRAAVLPEHKVHLIARERIEDMLLGGKVEGRVRRPEIQIAQFRHSSAPVPSLR